MGAQAVPASKLLASNSPTNDYTLYIQQLVNHQFRSLSERIIRHNARIHQEWRVTGLSVKQASQNSLVERTCIPDMVEVGDKAQNFSLEGIDGEEIREYTLSEVPVRDQRCSFLRPRFQPGLHGANV